MLQNKIEAALVNKYIAKITLSESNIPVYGVLTNRIRVLNNNSENESISTYRYYFKEIDIDQYSIKKDVNKSLKSVMTIMHDQIIDIEESFTNNRNIT